MSRSHGYENLHGRTVASDACWYGHVLLLPAWVCMSIRLTMFSSSSMSSPNFIGFDNNQTKNYGDRRASLGQSRSLTLMKS